MTDESANPQTWYWEKIIREQGPRGVVSLSITDEELAAETHRQIAAIFPMFEPLLQGEVTCLDYGCGGGRFTSALAATTNCLTTGYDHCAGFSAFWKDGPDVEFTSDRTALIDGSYEIVFCFAVLGDPHLDTELIAEDIARLLTPRGLLVVVDHMTVDDKERWWRVRPESSYLDLFRRHGIELRLLGRDKQLQNHISVLGGRKGGRSG